MFPFSRSPLSSSMVMAAAILLHCLSMKESSRGVELSSSRKCEQQIVKKSSTQPGRKRIEWRTAAASRFDREWNFQEGEKSTN